MADENDVTLRLSLDDADFVNKILKNKDLLGQFSDKENVSGLKEGFEEIQGVIGNIAGAEGWGSVTEALLGTLPILAPIIAAVVAMKAAFEMTLEAEQIKAVNAQFEMLTQNAGIAASALKEGLIEASGGLLTETELLESANKALVTMGGSASRLPEIMEIARKYTATFGGDLKSNFDQLNLAIATGQQRMLRHMGIVVDVNKAQKEYADSIGVAVNALSQMGKQQALTNAVIEKANQSYKGTNVNIKEATNTWQQFKTTIKEVGETASVVFEKTFGNIVRSILHDIAKDAKDVRDALVASFGEGTEQAAARINRLKDQLKLMDAQLEVMIRTKGTPEDGILARIFKGSSSGVDSPAVKAAKARIEAIKKEIESLEQKVSGEKTKGGAAGVPAIGGEGAVDKEKLKADQAKFEQDLLKLREQRIQAEIALNGKKLASDEQVKAQEISLQEALHAEISKIESSPDFNPEQKGALKVEAEKTTEAKIAALWQHHYDEEIAQQEKFASELQRLEATRIDSDIKANDDIEMADTLLAQKRLLIQQQLDAEMQKIDMDKSITESQREALRVEQHAIANQKIKSLDDELESAKDTALQNQLNNSKNVSSGIANAFQQGTRNQQKALSDFGAQGKFIYTDFTNTAVDAFKQVGEGGKSGSEILQSAVGGMIGDIAGNYGQMLLLTSIWPPDPVGLAAGAALLVLAGKLHSSASGASSAITTTPAAAVPQIPAPNQTTPIGSETTAPAGGISTSVPNGSNIPLPSQMTPSRSVTVQVQGHMFGTDETQRWLIDQIRQATDATDFKYVQVGQV